MPAIAEYPPPPSRRLCRNAFVGLLRFSHAGAQLYSAPWLYLSPLSYLFFGLV